MNHFATRFRPELVASSVFIAPGAIVVGDVTIGDDSTVWFSAVIRGDVDKIMIGTRSNIQDGCIIHTDPGIHCTIGDSVTIGHGAVIHGATIESGCLIGMRATIMNHAVIGAGSVVGAGALVPEGRKIPPHSLAVGAPARVIREISESDRQLIVQGADHYVEAGKAYRGDSEP